MLAIAGALFIPACGGGGGGGGNNFLSVSQFEAGVGIFITGVGNVMKVHATDYAVNGSNNKTEGTWRAPVNFDPDEKQYDPMTGWGENGAVCEKSAPMRGNVSFGDGPQIRATSIEYETLGSQYGHMVIYFGSDALRSDSTQDQLAALFGVVRASDIDDAGNTRNLFWWDDHIGRYLATSMNNGRIEIWFNFAGNGSTGLMQFYTQVAYVIEYNTNGTVKEWYGPSDAPIFTYENATVSKDY